MTITPTLASALPQHEGRPVPWVTRWSGEIIRDSPSIARGRDGLYIEYRDGKENREASGILWMREGLRRGGVPQYADFNTYRQRLAMSRQRCQVCGNKIDERPIRWLVPTDAFEIREDGTAMTTSPPTCSACIPLAMSLCPHLSKSDWAIVKVLEYSLWGVQGDYVELTEDNMVKHSRNAGVGYDEPEKFMRVLAKQSIAQFTKFVIEETSSS